MSLENVYSITHLVGDGENAEFPFEFKVWEAGHVKVYVNATGEQEDVTDKVTITLTDGGEAGGKVTFSAPPEKDVRIAIARQMPFIQEDRYITGTRIDPHELEDRFDQDCAERQELRDAIGRCIKVSETSSQSAAEIMQSVEENAAEVEQLKEDCLAALEEIREADYAPRTALEEVQETLVSVGEQAEGASSAAATVADDLADFESATNENFTELSTSITGSLETMQLSIDEIGETAQGAAELASQALDVASAAFHYKGSVATVGDLPNDADAGDVYVVEADGSMYVSDGTDWIDFNMVAVDQTIIANSSNPVAGGAVKTALDTKLAKTSVDQSIVASSQNPVAGGAVKTALDAKANDSNTVHKSGTEEISGAKTFQSAPKVQNNYPIFALDKVNDTQNANPSDIRFLIAGTAEAVVRLSNGKSLHIGTKSGTDAWGNGAQFTLENGGDFTCRAQNASTGTILRGKPNGTLTWAGRDIITNGGDQTIAGAKVFTSGPRVENGYPIVAVKRTDVSNPSDIRFFVNDDFKACIRLGPDNSFYVGAAGNGASWLQGPMLTLKQDNSFTLRSGYGDAMHSLVGTAAGSLTWDGVDITAAAKTNNVPFYDYPYRYNFQNNLATLRDQIKDAGGDASAYGVTPHNYTRNIQGTFVDPFDKIMAVLSSGSYGNTGIGFFVWDENPKKRTLIKYFSGLKDFAAHQGIQLYRPKASDSPLIVSQGNYYTGSGNTENPQNTLTAHVISITYPKASTSSLSWQLKKVFKMFDTSAWYTSGDNTAYKCRFCLSVDGRYMIALAKKKSNDKWYYRIWDFPAIMAKYANTSSSISSPTDVQSDVLYEFEQKRTPSTNYTQGIFSDGTWIFNLFGSNSTAKAYKIMYEGILSNTTGNFEGTLSVPSELSSLNVTIMESESIFFAPYNNRMEMFLGVSCINDGDHKYNRYYLLPSNKVTW